MSNKEKVNNETRNLLKKKFENENKLIIMNDMPAVIALVDIENGIFDNIGKSVFDGRCRTMEAGTFKFSLDYNNDLITELQKYLNKLEDNSRNDRIFFSLHSIYKEVDYTIVRCGLLLA